jgi:hypothetical protein
MLEEQEQEMMSGNQNGGLRQKNYWACVAAPTVAMVGTLTLLMIPKQNCSYMK